MKIAIIDDDVPYTHALMEYIKTNQKNMEIDVFPSLLNIKGEKVSFPTKGIDIVLISEKALDKYPNKGTTLSLRELFGDVPMIINCEKDNYLKVQELKKLRNDVGDVILINKQEGISNCVELIHRVAS